MGYYWIKYLHLTTVALNICIFLLRFYWMLHNPALVHKRSIRYISISNDSLLLIAGLSMALMSRQYPFVEPWLTAKLLALLAYIILGSIALTYGTNIRVRIGNGIMAILCVLYIVSVAYGRTPYPWMLFWS